MNTSVYRSIKDLLSSERWRKHFQKYCLLDSSSSLDLWEVLAENVERYVLEIRKRIPLPELAQVCVTCGTKFYN